MSVRDLRRAEVMGRVKRQELRLAEAAELLGLGVRQVKRLKRRYAEGGARNLAHRSLGRRSHRARPEAERQRALQLVQERYGGDEAHRFGPTLAAEELAKSDLVVSAETLRRWMLAEGLWSRSRRHKPHRQRRARKEHFGELVQMDGSFHPWLEERAGVACLMDLVDDASGVTEGGFEEQETTWGAADALRRWVEKYGIPLALYTDYKNVYVAPGTSAEKLRGIEPVSQFGGMCQRLGTRIIAAGSPQAKGRIERGHGTHQDRLVKKMRLAGVGDYGAANAFLPAYWAEHNRRFAHAPGSAADYHRKVPRGMNLDQIFSLRVERVLSRDWVISYRERWLQLERGQRVRPKQKVTVEEQRSGKLRLLAGNRELRWRELPCRPSRRLLPRQATLRAPYHPPTTHPWRQAALTGERVRQAEARALEMTGRANRGSHTTAPPVRTPLGNPA